jgi:nitrilase
VIGCNQYFRKGDFPENLRNELAPDRPEVLSSGGSVIVGPLGDVLAGPLHGEEGVLVAEVDLDEVVRSRMDFDVTGHYARDDIFEFSARGQPETKKH